MSDMPVWLIALLAVVMFAPWLMALVLEVTLGYPKRRPPWPTELYWQNPVWHREFFARLTPDEQDNWITKNQGNMSRVVTDWLKSRRPVLVSLTRSH